AEGKRTGSEIASETEQRGPAGRSDRHAHAHGRRDQRTQSAAHSQLRRQMLRRRSQTSSGARAPSQRGQHRNWRIHLLSQTAKARLDAKTGERVATLVELERPSRVITPGSAVWSDN